MDCFVAIAPRNDDAQAFAQQIQQNDLSGKSPKSCQGPFDHKILIIGIKNLIFRTRKSAYIQRILSQSEGRIRIVRDAGQVAMTRWRE